MAGIPMQHEREVQTLVQSGTRNITGVSGDWVLDTITFSKSYKKPPLVSVTQYDTGNVTNWPLPMIKNIGNTGFTFGWYNVSGQRQIIWQAIGEVDLNN